jgi:hypothetical protein
VFLLEVLAILVVAGLYLRHVAHEREPRPEMTEERIKQQWRELGFFSEVDNEKRIWTLTGSRAGLLYFPDLLLGYVADPQHASDGANKRYGPYGSLEVMTRPDAGFAGNAIRGSLVALTHLAELIEVKLATAEPGLPIRIRAEFAPDSPFTLVLDVRADGFDPASADRERLGPTTNVPAKEKHGSSPPSARS